MDKRRVITAIRQHADDIRAFGVVHVYLFGSTARGKASAGSDVDVFVDLRRGAKFSLFDLMDLRTLLGGILGARADVFLRQGLHRAIRREVVRAAVRVF